jgi:hypothetical protein
MQRFLFPLGLGDKQTKSSKSKIKHGCKVSKCNSPYCCVVVIVVLVIMASASLYEFADAFCILAGGLAVTSRLRLLCIISVCMICD